MSPSTINSNYVPPQYESADHNDGEISNLSYGISLLAASIIIPLGFELMTGYPLTFVAHPAVATLALVCAIAGLVYVILGLTEGDTRLPDEPPAGSRESKSSFHLHVGGNNGSSSSYRSHHVPILTTSYTGPSYPNRTSHVPYSSSSNYSSFASTSSVNGRGQQGGGFNGIGINLDMPLSSPPPPSYSSGPFTSFNTQPSSSFSSSVGGRGAMSGHYQSTTTNSIPSPSVSFSSSPPSFSSSSSSSSSSTRNNGRGAMGGGYQSSTTNLPSSASLKVNVGGPGFSASLSGRGIILD
jgi:hypothetical protein